MTTNQTSETKTCECGCGAPVASRFLPGHDAKLKGKLINATKHYNRHRRAAAVRRMVAMGWGQYANPVAVAEIENLGRDRLGRFAKSVNLHQVEAEGAFADAVEVTHAFPTCTMVKGEAVPAPVGNGWACSSCIRTEDLSDVIAFQVMYKADAKARKAAAKADREMVSA